MPRHLSFEQPTGHAVPADRQRQVPREQPQPRVLYTHPDDPGVLIEPTRDGNDFIRLCVFHQYASVPTPFHAPACPFCLCEVEQAAGHIRYFGLQLPTVTIREGR